MARRKDAQPTILGESENKIMNYLHFTLLLCGMMLALFFTPLRLAGNADIGKRLDVERWDQRCSKYTWMEVGVGSFELEVRMSKCFELRGATEYRSGGMKLARPARKEFISMYTLIEEVVGSLEIRKDSICIFKILIALGGCVGIFCSSVRIENACMPPKLAPTALIIASAKYTWRKSLVGPGVTDLIFSVLFHFRSICHAFKYDRSDSKDSAIQVHIDGRW